LLIQAEVDRQILFDCQRWNQTEAGERNAGDGVHSGADAGRKNGTDDALPVDEIAERNGTILCMSFFESNTRLIISGAEGQK
jgi:hypothetical protein